jgi:penicillin-binding protein 1C
MIRAGIGVFVRARGVCRLLIAGAAALACLLGLAAFAWLATPDPLPRVLRWPVSQVLLDAEGNLIHARLSAAQEWNLPVPLEAMGRWLPKILVAVEDKRFYDHVGVDVLALCRALWQNATAGRVVSGASTVSSQLVRLSVPRERTVSAKFLEFMGALKLERRLSKARILELYLNRAPFGGPIRGVEAAARLYFGKRAADLSLGEAALLVGMLKGPTAYRPDKNPRAALARRQRIIAQVAERTGFPDDLRDLALAEPLPAFRTAMPAAARHFADLAFAGLPAEGGTAYSTLDMRAQRILERELERQLRRAGDDVTAAGLVVDNRSASIIAYVGNARFDPANGRQWVDCAIAPRSPGSALKPFIYLKAMEAGHIIPASLLADTPLRLGGEAPRNFSRDYRGPVTAHAALADSLNAPAVRVTRLLGVRETLAFLRRAGFSFLDRRDEEYGDSLALGAGEATALELARAYTTLANLGRDRPLLVRRAPSDREALFRSRENNGEGSGDPGGNPQPSAFENGMPRPRGAALPGGLADAAAQLAAERSGTPPAARQLYSREAAYLISEILKDPGRLPFLAQLLQLHGGAPAAFKTGTSFGLRDAWTAAYTPAHTVVIWFGRAGGGADAQLVGISMAAPGALAVLRALSAAAPASWHAAPPGLASVRVCALSGAALSPFCPAGRTVQAIRGVWRTVPCSMHVLREGKIALVWPPELEDFRRKRFAREDCSRRAEIVSPLPGARYLLTPGARRNPIVLKAEGVDYPVHWYADGLYLGRQEREDLPLYWTPGGGDHAVSLLDARDRVAAASVPVTDLGDPGDPPASPSGE